MASPLSALRQHLREIRRCRDRQGARSLGKLSQGLPSALGIAEHLFLSPTPHHSATETTTMLVIGLTGGIATGKSTVSSMLKAFNIPIVDADVIARQVVEPGTPALEKIKRVFGSGVLLPDGALDRKKLGSIIFNDEGKRKQLNGIVHPAVRKEMLWQVLGFWIRGHKYCVMDVPLLIEGGLWQLVAQVVVVYCSEELQLQRLMQRDGSSREDATSRLKSQLPISEKVAYADIVIDNSGSKQDLERHVEGLIQKMERQAGWSWRLSWFVPPIGLFRALWTLLWRRVARRPKRSSK